jgi:omega-6 fatty acid desaturase (delta-12 desaturase)
MAQCISAGATSKDPAVWCETIARYRRPDVQKSWLQLANSLLPFFGLWYLMYRISFVSSWGMLLLAVPTAGFLVRIFIIQHDCGHHSFFRSRRANDVLGFLCGILTMTPYHYWRRTHSRHHVTSGNLDHRGYGDVGMLTVKEYLGLSAWGRWGYRVYRHPFFMFVLGATYLFVIYQRFTHGVGRTWRKERYSVYATNVAILLVLAVAWLTIGLQRFLLVHGPVMVLGAIAGSWLFFVQHQFEAAYWRSDKSWEFEPSALQGSSYYRLPALLQWFTGNIGFHHIHHLDSRIPNYHLPACYEAEPALREAVTFGFWESLSCSSLKLWDEDQERMVRFSEVRIPDPAPS